MAKCRLYLKLCSVWYRNTCSPNRRTHGLRTATKFSCVSSLVHLSPVSHSVSKLSYDKPQNTAALHSKLVNSKESLYRCFSCFVKMCINIHPPQSHVHRCHHLLNTSRPSLIFSRPSHSLDKLKLSLNKYIRHWRNVPRNNSPHYVVLDNVLGSNESKYHHEWLRIRHVGNWLHKTFFFESYWVLFRNINLLFWNKTSE